MDNNNIEQHYIANRQRLVKRMSFRAGSIPDGEDIVQEAYERAIKYSRSFTGGKFDKWFSTILNNCLRDHKNMQNGHAVQVFDEEEAEGTPCQHYTDQVMKEIHEKIENCAPVAREILHLFFYQEYSPVDISRITDHSYANCHQVIRRFRQELKEAYR